MSADLILFNGISTWQRPLSLHIRESDFHSMSPTWETFNFQQLPLEIRLEIWKLSLEPRTP